MPTRSVLSLVPDANIIGPPRCLHKQQHVAVSNGNIVINLKAAKQIGLTLSPEFLSRANKVIKESAGIKPAWSSG